MPDAKINSGLLTARHILFCRIGVSPAGKHGAPLGHVRDHVVARKGSVGGMVGGVDRVAQLPPAATTRTSCSIA
jgi:hypothetical protein